MASVTCNLGELCNRERTRETSLVESEDGLGDIGSLDAHLLLGSESINLRGGAAGDDGVLLV